MFYRPVARRLCEEDEAMGSYRLTTRGGLSSAQQMPDQLQRITIRTVCVLESCGGVETTAATFSICHGRLLHASSSTDFNVHASSAGLSVRAGLVYIRAFLRKMTDGGSCSARTLSDQEGMA